MYTILNVVLVSLASMLWVAFAHATDNPPDRHVGYYYPKPQIREIYKSSIDIAPGASPRVRADFAVALTLKQRDRAYAPTYHVFVKGKFKEKLIIVATEKYTTAYRLRALLAAMTSEARSTALLDQAPNPERLTFLDSCKAMGFARITVSDGEKVAIQIDIK